MNLSKVVSDSILVLDSKSLSLPLMWHLTGLFSSFYLLSLSPPPPADPCAPPKSATYQSLALFVREESAVRAYQASSDRGVSTM